MRVAGILAVTTAIAGCSNDVTRLQDSFYTGAIPQGGQQQQALAQSAPQAAQQGYGGGYPSPQGYPSGPAGGDVYAAAAPSGSAGVSRSQLPPPAAATQAGQPVAQTAPQPAATSVAASGNTVTVTSGDSLSGIANRHGVRTADLRAANGLTSDDIRIGQTLRLPAGAGAASTTQVASLGAPPTTLQAQAARVAPATANDANTGSSASVAGTPSAAAQAAPAQTAVQAPAAAQAAPAASTTVEEQTEQQQAALAPESTGISQFRWPVQGRVVKSFGDKVGTRRNDGLNISVPRGTSVKAAENGVVIYAGEGLKEFGKTVLVKHDNGLVTVYGHADEILVERGATVRRGQDIAKAGMTGDADQPMLHFEVRKDSSPVNPMTYLQ